jgi:ribonuclease HII
MPDFSLEKAAWNDGLPFYGFDEAGYGTGAGSMWIAVVSFPSDLDPSLLSGVKDSKKTTVAQRIELSEKIKKYAERWHVFEVSAKEMDENNSYWLRYTTPISWLNEAPVGVTCFDGNKALICKNHTNTFCVKGDGVSLSIAAASILAKSAKDKECLELDQIYPEWKFSEHSGYLSSEHHKMMLKTHGALTIHRTKYIRNFVKAQ